MSQEIKDYLDAQTDEKVLSILGAVITDDEYEETDYTELVKSIADSFTKFKRLTPKQRNAVCRHLAYHKRLWYG